MPLHVQVAFKAPTTPLLTENCEQVWPNTLPKAARMEDPATLPHSQRQVMMRPL